MAHLYRNYESELQLSKDNAFNDVSATSPNIRRTRDVQPRLLIGKPDHYLKQVRYHASSTIGKCLLATLLTIMFARSANAQLSVSSRFHYDGTDERLIQAITIADSILSTERFWNDIRNWRDQYIENTDTLSYSMSKLADTLRSYQRITNIRLASKLSFHVSTGKTDGNGTLITRRGLRQDLRSLAVTIIHEWVHAVDYQMHGANNLKFEHFGDQHRCLNKETASYRVERVAESMLGNPDFAQNCPCQLPCYSPCDSPSPCPRIQ